MRSAAAQINIDEAVTVGLTCLEQGLDNKATVKRNILEAVSKNSIPVSDYSILEDFPVEVFNLLHEQLGIGFNVQAGKITGVTIEGGEFDPVRKGKLERLFGLIERNGIDFGSGPDMTIFTHSKGGEN